MSPDAGSDAGPHPFVSAAAGLLPRAAASGERLVTALYLILQTHAAVPARDSGAASRLVCAECRPAPRGLPEQYPCRTAQQAFWALDAILR